MEESTLAELKAVGVGGARKSQKTEKMRAILDAAMASSPTLERIGPLLDYCTPSAGDNGAKRA